MVSSLDCPSSASFVVTHHDLVELAQDQSRERSDEGSDPSLPSDVDALELEESALPQGPGWPHHHVMGIDQAKDQ